MKPEQKTWKNLREKMRGQWKADRIETETIDGFPDVVYTCDGVTGYIELKHLPSFPVRADTHVKLHRFTRQQLNFALNVKHYGGKSWMFVEVGHELFLFDPDAMNAIYDGVATAGFRGLVTWYCESWKGFDVEFFMGCIR